MLEPIKPIDGMEWPELKQLLVDVDKAERESLNEQ